MTYQDILDRYAQSVYNKDVEGFLSIYDPEVLIFDTWNAWMSTDINAVRSMATQWFDSLDKEKVRVEFTTVNVLHSAEQTVWIGELKFYGLSEDGQVLRSISNRWTWVMKKCDKGLKVVHEHSSLPINMETFTGIMKPE